MDKFPITMLLVMVYLLTSCEGWPESGKYWYICSDKSAETCLASSASNNNVEVKSLSLHWEEQQHFVWKIDEDEESFYTEWRIENLVGGSDSSKKFLSPREKNVVELSSDGGHDLQRSWRLEGEKDQSYLIQNNKVAARRWCMLNCPKWEGNWLYKKGDGLILKSYESLHLYCSRSQRSSFLYIVWIYVDEYMANNAAAKALMDTLGKFTRCTFEGPLRDEKAFAVHYDIAEDFYELIVQYIRKAHCQLIQRPLFVRTLWERAICGLLLDHDKALDAITAFFTECIAMASYDETHRELVDQLLFGGPQFYGRRIIHQILRGFCGKVRRERAVTLGNLLDAMLKYNAQQTEQLTRQLVAEEISLKSQDPTKEEFVDEYFDSRNDSRFRMRYILEWFDANDRYLRSTTF